MDPAKDMINDGENAAERFAAVLIQGIKETVNLIFDRVQQTRISATIDIGKREQ